MPTAVEVGVPDENLEMFKALCLADLANHGITRLSFDWELADRSPWNQTVAIFIAKHWQYAYSQGAFDDKAIWSAHNTEKTCIGIILRWLRGRSEDIRQKRRSPEKLRQKEACRKKRMLFKYRADSLSRLLVARNLPQDASVILPHHNCCSDTEWDPEETQYPSVGLVWRSQQYTSLIHQIDGLSFKYSKSTQGARAASQRFDQCRTQATQTNIHAAVCPGLPENCYDPLFISNLTTEERAALNLKPVSNLLITLPTEIEDFAV
ncbi:uncharacterized protein MELLADRAFT_59734 [Melampsora larici-populina 98AG31]|uniref:Uncharacterized protein n=1 Tax=Melampsora larici-populina (strain 98AG31 / pathotype 3-4-7) TaxID=747676 RepID=F4R735_MELLP|nr:uncharacterized protein MELLADRAFT_59734 [Melampsora larici-populina 98AG31]EGG11579.1 hypothetical protein MELLADRAFT_59734 [Melampsora larici-populina 98AG31]